MHAEEHEGISDELRNRQMAIALSRWDGEGGAGPFGPQERASSASTLSGLPSLTNTELVQLRIRVIALENLVIGLLAEASDRQLHNARDMAAFISPRPGVTQHPLTIHAASQMIALIERAEHFRSKNTELPSVLATAPAPPLATL